MPALVCKKIDVHSAFLYISSMLGVCPFCALMKNPRENSTFIAEFENSVAFLNFDQNNYKGQTLLILKEHYGHLHMVPVVLQQKIVPELMTITKALLKAFGGFRANHQSLGNQVAHVHWHITPRYPDDRNSGGPPQHAPPGTISRLSDDEYRQISIKIQGVLQAEKSFYRIYGSELFQ